MSKTRQYVGASAVISIAVLVAAEEGRSKSLPPVNQLIAYGFVFFFLSALADFGLELAGPFAILAMVAIILEQGPDALRFFGQRSGTGDPTKAPKQPSRTIENVNIRR